MVPGNPGGFEPPILFLEKKNASFTVEEKNEVVVGPGRKRPLPQRDAALNRPAPRPYSPYENTGKAPIKPPNPQPRAEL